MQKTKKATKDVNTFNGSELAVLFHEYLAKIGHRDTLRAMNLIAHDYFEGAVILEEMDFEDEFEYLDYYQKLT